MSYDYNYNFNPQQNWMQPPPPPPKNPNAWVKWVVLGLVVLGLIIALAFFVARMGKDFGKAIGDVSKNTIEKSDSLQKISLDEDYDSVYAMIARDSSSQKMKWYIDNLKNTSDSIIEFLNKNQRGFNDTIKDISGLSLFDKSWAHHYFLETGRARKMKRVLLTYRESEIHFLPVNERDSSLRYSLMIDEMTKEMPAFLKNLSTWERINFDQPAMNININFKTIKSEVRNFEKEILIRYKVSIGIKQDADSIGNLHSGDSVRRKIQDSKFSEESHC